jgi:hypothetical protein
MSVTMLMLLQRIFDDTHAGRACERDIAYFRRLTGASERTVHLALREAEQRGWIRREQPDKATHRGGYRLHLEQIPEPFRRWIGPLRDATLSKNRRRKGDNCPVQAGQGAGNS